MFVLAVGSGFMVVSTFDVSKIDVDPVATSTPAAVEAATTTEPSATSTDYGFSEGYWDCMKRIDASGLCMALFPATSTASSGVQSFLFPIGTSTPENDNTFFVVPLPQQITQQPVEQNNPPTNPMPEPETQPTPTPAPAPVPEPPQPVITLEVITTSEGQSLSREYAVGESINLGLIVWSDPNTEGNAHAPDSGTRDNVPVTINSSDLEQPKRIEVTGNVRKVFKGGVEKLVSYYPYTYEFKVSGDHYVKFEAEGKEARIDLTVK